MNNNFEKYLGIANHEIQMANTSQELKCYVASILYENDKKVEEIERLNNIINELEKYIHNELVLDFYNDDMPCELIINKMEKMIKELKENNNV